jgi:hypothetical protein
MMLEEKEKLLAELDASRKRLNALIERIDLGWQIYGRWKLKEIVDHIAGWDDAVIASLASHGQGDVPRVTAPYGIDRYNAETVVTRETLPYDRSIREFHRTREILRQIIMDLPDEKFAQPLVLPWGLTGTVSDVVEVFVHHEHEHAEDLEAILHEHGL